MSKKNSHFTITILTRQLIADSLAASAYHWSGRMRETEFLARIFDLEKIPSTDPRYTDAARDISTHGSDGFKDWEENWVFSDPRFNLLRVPDELFLRFLCETIHPLVRRDPAESRELCDIYNNYLRADGWLIREDGTLSEQPLFKSGRTEVRVELFEEPTGWEKVDRQLTEAKRLLKLANTEENFQAVGLICREVLITLAETTYDISRYPTLDGIEASKTDAKRKLEAIVAVELAGAANEEARAHAKAALRFAVALQHRRTADFRMAALCGEATVSVVNVIAIIMGRRG